MEELETSLANEKNGNGSKIDDNKKSTSNQFSI